MTTYHTETHQTVTHNREKAGRNILCSERVLLCSNRNYDCAGNWIFDKDSHQTTTYYKETYN